MSNMGVGTSDLELLREHDIGLGDLAGFIKLNLLENFFDGLAET